MKNPQGGTWLSQVEGARSATELVELLRTYLASLSEQERAQLPAGCRPENISTAADIQDWAVTLAQNDLKSGRADATDAYHRAAVVFAAAGARLPRVSE